MQSAGLKLTILHGTETGNAAELARALEATAAAKGLVSTSSDMADYKVRQLVQEEDMLIVVRTYAEGDTPQPATGFFEFIEGQLGRASCRERVFQYGEIPVGAGS